MKLFIENIDDDFYGEYKDQLIELLDSMAEQGLDKKTAIKLLKELIKIVPEIWEWYEEE